MSQNVAGPFFSPDTFSLSCAREGGVRLTLATSGNYVCEWLVLVG